VSHRDDDFPPELEALERSLANIRFEPRASLGPELEGRVKRGEMPRGGRRSRFAWQPRLFFRVLAPLLLLAGLAILLQSRTPVLVDRCCYDLDGGGEEDDGVLIAAERDAQVHRLQVYEDRDQSRRFSAGDVIRLDRGNMPSMGTGAGEGLVTTRHCCIDLDGGGPSDDALLVIGVPPDRVVMAAIYEEPGPGRRDKAATRALRLR
jgi:hypothetical protein